MEDQECITCKVKATHRCYPDASFIAVYRCSGCLIDVITKTQDEVDKLHREHLEQKIVLGRLIEATRVSY